MENELAPGYKSATPISFLKESSGDLEELIKLYDKPSDLPRLYSIILNLRRVFDDKVEGNLAEVGVYRGNTAAVLFRFCAKYGRKLELFDTFEGFDERDIIGIDSDKIKKFDNTSLEAVIEYVCNNNDNKKYLECIKGYFPDSITDKIRKDKFCFVHLDCDLYKPIAAGLSFFWPRLSKGGVIIIHDYSSGSYKGCTLAVDEFRKKNNISITLLPDRCGSALIVK